MTRDELKRLKDSLNAIKQDYEAVVSKMDAYVRAYDKEFRNHPDEKYVWVHCGDQIPKINSRTTIGRRILIMREDLLELKATLEVFR